LPQIQQKADKESNDLLTFQVQVPVTGVQLSIVLGQEAEDISGGVTGGRRLSSEVDRTHVAPYCP